MHRNLPTGTVTFVFTDIEGSTKLLDELGAATYADTLAEHRKALREAFSRHDGVEVDTQGDAFFYAFPTGSGALAAAAEGQADLSPGPVRVRIGIHTGTPYVTEEGYVGDDVNKGARIAAAGHGGQVLISKETRELAEVDVTDLGEHRLKDFAEPVWIFQLGSERFPPLKTISNTNLPRPPSSFVGRESELKDVLRLFVDGARLVNLTGPGGSGKTRLAIEAAAELVADHKNGVFWIGLASLRDTALVTEEIARTLGAKDGLAAHIGERDMLLLLDNFEQVVDAAPELSSLLASCPNLDLLVTSRERLRVSGEVEYAVPPLAQVESVELFCKRSQLQPDATIAELCGRLDHLPLAVELAAARTSVLAPAQILERIARRLDLLKGGRDADPRQVTLRATIEWSYDLLSDEEKDLFLRLAVFAGGCTLKAAEDVTEADLDVLQSLVDKSLVRYTEKRFWMLETIRQYATERLEASDEADELRRRHAAYFLAAVEGATTAVQRPQGEPVALDRLERDHDNFRAALQRFEARGETQLTLRLAGAMADFWGERGHTTEGRRRLEDALRADARQTEARARALTGASILTAQSGDLPTAQLWAEESLAIHRKLENRWDIARAMHTLGYALAEQGGWARARDLFDESVQLFRDVGDEQFALWVTRSLAWTYLELGDSQRGRELHEENLKRTRALGDRGLEAILLGALAMAAVEDGRIDDALSLLRENVPIYDDLGDPLESTDNLCRCAHALACAGRPVPATQILACADALFDEMGADVPYVTRMNEQTLTVIRVQLDEAAFADAWAEGQRLTAEDATALALDSLQ